MTPDSPAIRIRALAARDSLDAVTALLHLAYAPLAARGMNFAAATQSATMTRTCAAQGQCFVAERGGAVVGTVTVSGPYDETSAPAGEAPWRWDADTAHFHQFAVHPQHQGAGIGRQLVAACEAWARERGYRRIALDTAEPAHELRALYARLGYAEVGRQQWPERSYCSVIMRKALDRSPLAGQLQTLARYHLWATRRLFEAVDALPEADYLRDMGLFFASVHGTLEHLLVCDVLWWRRFAHGESPVIRLDAQLEPERAALEARLLSGAAAWETFVEALDDAHLAGTLDYRTTRGNEVSLPFAVTLAHVFNHGTHHRGQISAALTALGRTCPELDLVYMLVQQQKLQQQEAAR